MLSWHVLQELSQMTVEQFGDNEGLADMLQDTDENAAPAPGSLQAPPKPATAAAPVADAPAAPAAAVRPPAAPKRPVAAKKPPKPPARPVPVRVARRPEPGLQTALETPRTTRAAARAAAQPVASAAQRPVPGRAARRDTPAPAVAPTPGLKAVQEFMQANQGWGARDAQAIELQPPGAQLMLCVYISHALFSLIAVSSRWICMLAHGWSRYTNGGFSQCHIAA